MLNTKGNKLKHLDIYVDIHDPMNMREVFSRAEKFKLRLFIVYGFFTLIMNFFLLSSTFTLGKFSINAKWQVKVQEEISIVTS